MPEIPPGEQEDDEGDVPCGQVVAQLEVEEEGAAIRGFRTGPFESSVIDALGDGEEQVGDIPGMRRGRSSAGAKEAAGG